MKELTDHGILTVLAVMLMFQTEYNSKQVIALLVGMIVAAVGIYIEETRWYYVTLVVGIFLCFMLKPLLPFCVYFCYQICRRKMYTGFLLLLPEFYLMTQTEWKTLFLWLIVCVVAGLLGMRTVRVEELDKELIHIRDEGMELQMSLREKNKSLMEKQDYEIYLATLKERNRIAREIHDNVGHILSRSILQMGALCTIYKEEPLQSQLKGVNDTLNQAMNSIRESVHDLHDDSIDLKHAVLDAVADLKETYQIDFDYDMTKNVPRNVKYCFISTVKEAVSNVLKHSDADKIQIMLREHPGFYQLSIEDNGSNQKQKTESGIGLVNMQQRVEALNGTLRIQTENGFRIFISIPCRKEILK